MPYIDVKILAGRLTPETERELVERLTAAVTDTFGAGVGEQTWVVLQEVPPARWGVAGRPCAPVTA